MTIEQLSDMVGYLLPEENEPLEFDAEEWKRFRESWPEASWTDIHEAVDVAWKYAELLHRRRVG